MRSSIKWMLCTLALATSGIGNAAEFASPEPAYERPGYIPVISDIFGIYNEPPPPARYEYVEPYPEPRVRRSVPRVKRSGPARPATRVTRTSPVRVERAPRVRGGYCEALRPRVTSLVGPQKASCYLKLFHIESTCRWNLAQAQGNAGNPYAAYGLCSIERSPVIRRLQRRPKECNDIGSFDNQVRCCQAMMRKTPHYFGPVLAGKVPRCG